MNEFDFHSGIYKEIGFRRLFDLFNYLRRFKLEEHLADVIDIPDIPDIANVTTTKLKVNKIRTKLL